MKTDQEDWDSSHADGVVRFRQVDTVASQIAGANERRLELLFTGPPSGTVTLSTEPNPQSTQGLLLTPGMILRITLWRHGGAVKKPWYAIASSSSTLGFLEVSR